jgi:hypothetical protein
MEQEKKTGNITIIAKTINGKASGTIQENAKNIKNITGGKFTQNGKKGGLIYDVNKSVVPLIDLRVKKITSVNKKIEINNKYTFTATEFTRAASSVELFLVKWAYQFDDGEIQHCKQRGIGVTNKTQVTKDIYVGNVGTATKLRVYAFIEKPTKDASVEIEIITKPKIIFINGQWNIADRLPYGDNFGPTKPKKDYWYDRDEMVIHGITYFNLKQTLHLEGCSYEEKKSIDYLEQKGYVTYLDGSSQWGFDESGEQRFIRGSKYAKDNYNELTSGIGKNKVYLVSHSEGCAFAAGVADFFHSKGIKIGEHILLSADEADEFRIKPEIPSYQLTYMFFDSIYNPLPAFINYKKIKMRNKTFKQWGDKYAIVDWVVNEFRIQGVKKFGIVRKDNLGWGTVHGSSNDIRGFHEVDCLKKASLSDAWNSEGKIVRMHNDLTYNLDKNTFKTRFYRIDDEYITSNIPMYK